MISRFFIIVSILLQAFDGFAVNWRIEPADLFPKEYLEILETRYPTINTSNELAKLLKDLGQKKPALSLEAHANGSQWLIQIVPSKSIGKITFETTTYQLRQKLMARTSSYLGQPNYNETQEKLLSLLKNLLSETGYPHAAIGLTELNFADSVELVFKVEERQPCSLSKVNLYFNLPAGLSLYIPPGSLCDLEMIRQKTDQLENELSKEGFYNSHIDSPQLIYDSSKNTATLNLKGTIGRRVTYDISDDRGLGSFSLFGNSEILTEDEQRIIDPDNIENEILKRYRNLGYEDAKILRSSQQKQSAFEYTYKFKVQTGPQFFISAIQIDGLTRYTQKVALEIMGLGTIWASSIILNPEAINDSIEQLKSAYLAEGFWNIKIRYPNLAKNETTGSVKLFFIVEEGQQRILAEAKVSGNQLFDDKEIFKMLALKKDQPINQSKVVDFEQSLRVAMTEQGYRYCQVSVDLASAKIDRSNRVMVTMKIRINEGTRVKYGSISILGLKKTKPKVILRELRFATGDWYQPDAIESSRKALLNLGLFRSVAITPADPNALDAKEEVLDYLITIREGDSGSVTFGPGYNLVEGLRFNSEFSYNNLNGNASRFVARGEINEQQQQTANSNKTLVGRTASVSYLEPYFYDLPFDAQTIIRHQAKVVPQNTALWQIDYGGEVSMTHKFRNWLEGGSLGLFYAQKINLELGKIEDKVFLFAKGITRISEPGLRFMIDKRDSASFPSAGFLLETQLSKADYLLSGTLKYTKWQYNWSIYQGVTSNTVLAFNLGMTSYNNVRTRDNDLDILPPSERLSAGGAGPGSVRGYRYASLGPFVRHPGYDDTTDTCSDGFELKTVGGHKRTIATLELRYRIQPQLGVSGFIDSGNVFLTPSEFKAYQQALNEQTPGCAIGRATLEENIYYPQEAILRSPKLLYTKHAVSFGPAVNYLTPIGSLAFACGFPMHLAKTERCEQDEAYCISRNKNEPKWYKNSICSLNIGTHF